MCWPSDGAAVSCDARSAMGLRTKPHGCSVAALDLRKGRVNRRRQGLWAIVSTVSMARAGDAVCNQETNPVVGWLLAQAIAQDGVECIAVFQPFLIAGETRIGGEIGQSQ